MILLELSKILRDSNKIIIKSSFVFLIIDQTEIYLHQLRQLFKSNRILIDINGHRTILRISRNVISVRRLSCHSYETLTVFQQTVPNELSFCHKLTSFNSCNSATRSCRPLTFQTQNPDRSHILSLKYKSFTVSGCKD